ncbi:MAG TPA: DUF4160 domain-containing protein [Gemmatimonadales bacterium]|nr:DUF4160 domain-containing protein [Gemmatimonadales bacterium]
MPTVLRIDGFLVRVHGPPREHPPPHVHVERDGGGMSVIRLGDSVVPPTLWWVVGMSRRDQRRALRLVLKHHDLLLATWERIHGDPTTD